MNLTTPKIVTNDIVRFCSEIDSTSSPAFVPVIPVGNVRHGYCLTDVPSYAEKNGGNVQFGWIIWECVKVALEAEFHACWRNCENELVDIVSKPDNEEIILFLPDNKRIYELKPVCSRQKALIDNDYTKRWLMTGKKKYEIGAKNFKNDEVDAVAAEAEFEKWLCSLPPGFPKIGRNDPCPCGSGEKYKICCGR